MGYDDKRNQGQQDRPANQGRHTGSRRVDLPPVQSSQRYQGQRAAQAGTQQSSSRQAQAGTQQPSSRQAQAGTQQSSSRQAQASSQRAAQQQRGATQQRAASRQPQATTQRTAQQRPLADTHTPRQQHARSTGSNGYTYDEIYAGKRGTGTRGTKGAAAASPAWAQGSAYSPIPPKKSRKGLIIAIVIIVLAVAGALAWAFIAGPLSQQAEPAATEEATVAEPVSTANTVHFLAVGDNLPDDDIGNAGLQSDGSYNYDFLFANIKPYASAADLALITSETHLGGNERGCLDYPQFNAMDEMADAIVNAGFDVVALATNHSFDCGYEAGAHNVEVWESKGVTTLGMYASQEDADTLRTKTINGITFAFLDYTYGVNGMTEDDFDPWDISFFDEDKITAEVTAAQQAADVVVVFAHWGTEKTRTNDDFQAQYAQLFADLGVDIVVGSHPHVIQPMTWVTGKNGNSTLVTYSLGNFTSNFVNKDDWTQIGGMLECDVVKDGDQIRLENVTWVPVVNHNEAGNYTVYNLKDYTPEIAARQPYLIDLDDPITFVKETTAEIVNGLGDNFVIEGVSTETTTEDSSRVTKSISSFR